MKLTLMKMKWKINSWVVKIGSKLGIIKPNGMYYMGGVNILPPPLKPDEERLLIDRLEKDDDVKTILIERNLRLVVYISRKFENTGIDVEDLISIGTIGLIKAVNTFKSNKNIKLATYASRCIENEILMYLRKNNKKKAEVSFDEPLNTDLDGNELLLSDVLGTENDEIYKRIMIMDSIKSSSTYIKTCDIYKSDLNKLCKRYNVFVPPSKVTKEYMISIFINATICVSLKNKAKNRYKTK